VDGRWMEGGWNGVPYFQTKPCTANAIFNSRLKRGK
jgi:hypothetical protein